MGNRKIQHRVQVLTDYVLRLYCGKVSFLVAFNYLELQRYGCSTVRNARVDEDCLYIGGSWKMRLSTLRRNFRRHARPWNRCGLYWGRHSFCSLRFTDIVNLREVGELSWEVEFADGYKGIFKYDRNKAESILKAIEERRAAGKPHAFFGFDNVFGIYEAVFYFNDTEYDLDNNYESDAVELKGEMLLGENDVADFNKPGIPFDHHDSIFYQYYGPLSLMEDFLRDNGSWKGPCPAEYTAGEDGRLRGQA